MLWSMVSHRGYKYVAFIPKANPTCPTSPRTKQAKPCTHVRTDVCIFPHPVRSAFDLNRASRYPVLRLTPDTVCTPGQGIGWWESQPLRPSGVSLTGHANVFATVTRRTGCPGVLQTYWTYSNWAIRIDSFLKIQPTRHMVLLIGGTISSFHTWLQIGNNNLSCEVVLFPASICLFCHGSEDAGRIAKQPKIDKCCKLLMWCGVVVRIPPPVALELEVVEPSKHPSCFYHLPGAPHVLDSFSGSLIIHGLELISVWSTWFFVVFCRHPPRVVHCRPDERVWRACLSVRELESWRARCSVLGNGPHSLDKRKTPNSCKRCRLEVAKSGSVAKLT